MGLFGSKPQQVVQYASQPRPLVKTLVNAPTEPLIPKLDNPPNMVTEFYIIAQRYAIDIEGKQAFHLNHLIRLAGVHNGQSGFTKDDRHFELYSTGKETIRTLDEKPYYSINDETGEFKFWPRFFHWLGTEKLVRVTAPQKWHEEHTTRVDPDFNLEWEPKFEMR